MAVARTTTTRIEPSVDQRGLMGLMDVELRDVPPGAQV